MLEAAGWHVQDYVDINLGASSGVAVREYQLTTGAADYLLFVNRRAIGAIEAKPSGTTLSGVESQSAKYSTGLPGGLQTWRRPLPFLYEATDIEIRFTNMLDPDPRGRQLFAFHQPTTLADWAREASTLRSRLRSMPALAPGRLWTVQREAILNLEQSLADDRPRALIQMATGSGKTFTSVSQIYRLIKFGGAKRVLFLVDRSNLGRQAENEFKQYVTPDDGRKFTELYNVQRLTSNTLDAGAKVCITTIQRLFSMLSGEPDLDPELEERSLFDNILNVDVLTPKLVRYNPYIPIEYFDFIVVDECHRSIYSLWRQVLEYFDAHLIGLTATPSKQTFGFFNRNLVMEYSRQHAVADNVNVDGQVYRIRTEIGERGSHVEAGVFVDHRDRKTRAVRWEALEDELVYEAAQLDRQVVAMDYIRTVIRTFRDRLPIDIFPGRREVPKTLIFAKDDSHAEDIVRIVREEFARGNDFCKKITYRVTGVKPEDLISEFRNDYNPRIAVTVDMIATGTDIKPLEIILFLRPVESRVLYEQMLGRGTRVISSTDLQAVTPDATEKTHFVIVDAVGVVDSNKVDTDTLERNPSIPFATLLNSIARGTYDAATLSSLAGRLARLQRRLNPVDIAAIEAAGGISLPALINTLIDATDPDVQYEVAQQATDSSEPTPEQVVEAASNLMFDVVAPFDNPIFRSTLINMQGRNEQIIDNVSLDTVTQAGFSEVDTEKARTTIQSFRQFLDDNKDEIAALEILFNRPYTARALTFFQVKELAERIKQPPYNWTPDALWWAFALLDRDRVRGTSTRRVLTDLVSLVRKAANPDTDLIPYPDQIQERYRAWLTNREASGHPFTTDQHWWLDQIAEHIGVNLVITPEDFEYGEFFNRGGRVAATRAFGVELPALLRELNSELAA